MTNKTKISEREQRRLLSIERLVNEIDEKLKEYRPYGSKYGPVTYKMTGGRYWLNNKLDNPRTRKMYEHKRSLDGCVFVGAERIGKVGEVLKRGLAQALEDEWLPAEIKIVGPTPEGMYGIFYRDVPFSYKQDL
jgi:hypothetical protein